MKCKECGGEFKKKQHNQIYCSVKCKNRFIYKNKKKPLEEILCANCGKEFLPNRRGQRFCSKACRIKFFNRKENKKIYSTKKYKYCIICGMPLLPRQHKYCKPCSEDKIRESKRAYNRKNMETILHKQRMMRLNRLVELGGECVFCGQKNTREIPLHIHHITPNLKPESKTQYDKISHVMLLCGNCHTIWHILRQKLDIMYM